MNGRCTSISGDNNNICNGTSVLNDGIIPALSGVSDDPQSQWADQLFTMRRTGDGMGRIILSFEVEPVSHDWVELVVFNCPKLGINTPLINVYSDTIFRPEKDDKLQLGNLSISQPIFGSSCDHLIRVHAEFSHETSEPYFNFEYLYQNNSNSSFVFLGEVTFFKHGKLCDIAINHG